MIRSGAAVAAIVLAAACGAETEQPDAAPPPRCPQGGACAPFQVSARFTASAGAGGAASAAAHEPKPEPEPRR